MRDLKYEITDAEKVPDKNKYPQTFLKKGQAQGTEWVFECRKTLPALGACPHPQD